MAAPIGDRTERERTWYRHTVIAESPLDMAAYVPGCLLLDESVRLVTVRHLPLIFSGLSLCHMATNSAKGRIYNAPRFSGLDPADVVACK